MKRARDVMMCTLVLCCARHSLAAESIAHDEHAVLNGDDNRRELFEVDSAPLKSTVANATAAVMWPHRLRRESAGIQLRAESLGEHFGLCAGEPYATEPSAASCSATLVDDDLVLTAGHCLGSDEPEARQRCPRQRFVFEYEIDEKGLLPIQPLEVYSCRAVAAFRKTTTASTFLDFAFVQLDRPVRQRAPIAVTTSAPRPGELVAFASHGAGLPVKVEENASIVSVPADARHFTAATDSFAGGSGGSVYDSELQLLGFAVRGAGDWVADGACMRAAHSAEASEQYQVAADAVRELCRNGWPSTRLCGTPAECGDGVCSASESQGNCALDCAAARCGDRVCDLDEDLTCQSDCPRFDDVPASWDLDPETYQRSALADGRSRASCSFEGGSPQRASWCGITVLGLLLYRRGRPRRTT